MTGFSEIARPAIRFEVVNADGDTLAGDSLASVREWLEVSPVAALLDESWDGRSDVVTLYIMSGAFEVAMLELDETRSFLSQLLSCKE